MRSIQNVIYEFLVNRNFLFDDCDLCDDFDYEVIINDAREKICIGKKVERNIEKSEIFP